MVARTDSTSAVSTEPRWSEPPAQANSPSMRPVASVVAATAAATWSSTVTSATTQRTDAPPVAAAAMRSRASSSFCSVRPQIVTCAPSAANRSAVASPMPLPPPVTRTDQPAMPADGPGLGHQAAPGARRAARKA